MQNPYESGHIKNYLFFYAAIVVIMILFFIAATLFHTPNVSEIKVFDTNISIREDTKQVEETIKTSPFKVLEKAY